jgi:hypothetical protein
MPQPEQVLPEFAQPLLIAHVFRVAVEGLRDRDGGLKSHQRRGGYKP